MTTAEANIAELKSSKEARGKRLKAARMQAGLSRADIERKYNISRLTQGNWENGKAGGLTEKGTKRMVYAFKQEGLYCTVDWLMDGVGNPPYPTDKLFIGDELERLAIDVEEAQEDHNSIAEELLAFRRCNKEAIDLMVKDDGMLPLYSIGDYVAGSQRYGSHIKSLLGRDCIVVLKSGAIVFRHIRGGEKNTYTLVCINQDATCGNFFLANVEVVSAAPVIWHRRRDF